MVSISFDCVARLLPMALHLGPEGAIHHAGATMRRLIPGRSHFNHAFMIDRPRDVTDGFAGLAQDLPDISRFFLRLRDHPGTVLRGHGIRLQDGGIVLNLGFGVGLPDAVRQFSLTDTDFTPADLAMELLFLHEANTAVQKELANFNQHTENARRVAEMQAYTDSLTGVNNRRGFEMALEIAVRQAEQMKFSIAHLDLDHFKEVNDRLGHAAGDEVLQRVAAILREETRATDTVSRIGGDEFTLILAAPRGSEQLRKFGERIIARIERPMMVMGREIRISVSMGITESTHYARADAAQMLLDADRALYAAKNAGRGCVVLFRDCPCTGAKPDVIR
ncbi:GGDEF domain-containing protein [Paracoccus sp. DMF-8]|uniref:GGDEF domain-containing protein n=1 Tax=Paracoccus sp. DMF-8 TaxID=3019445 RepID=UPI0023E770A8|nr:GGDEF domain-containing protein [Paracoccus sp. DMF-8]MDF3605953.1 GGDEF domain-containing protein [Paracoccus sp. DMF-8]